MGHLIYLQSLLSNVDITRDDGVDDCWLAVLKAHEDTFLARLVFERAVPFPLLCSPSVLYSARSEEEMRRGGREGRVVLCYYRSFDYIEPFDGENNY